MGDRDAILDNSASYGLEDTDSFVAVATRVDDVAIYSVVSHPPGRSSAPKIVLVHGLGLSQRYMMPLARELARDCHVYVPDQPGFGGSGHPERVLDMAWLAYAIAGWTQETGLRGAAFVGNSQ